MAPTTPLVAFRRKMSLYWAILFLLLPGPDFCASLRLVNVKVPNAALSGHSVQLECIFALEGDSLYAVKWYRGTDEFYRYVPAEDPPTSVFPLNGIEVDLDESNESKLVLRSISSETAGRFRCEVSAEAPSFQTVSGHADMVVVQLPQRGPLIFGGKARYSIGDTVDINCTSLRSSPAANLSWYINGEQADRSHLREYKVIEDVDGLETSILGLHFTIKSRHFRKGDLKLKCTATLAALYWQSNEASAEPDRPHHQRSSTSTIFLNSHGALPGTAASFRVSGPWLSTLVTFTAALIVFVIGTS